MSTSGERSGIACQVRVSASGKQAESHGRKPARFAGQTCTCSDSPACFSRVNSRTTHFPGGLNRPLGVTFSEIFWYVAPLCSGCVFRQDLAVAGKSISRSSAIRRPVRSCLAQIRLNRCRTCLTPLERTPLVGGDDSDSDRTLCSGVFSADLPVWPAIAAKANSPTREQLGKDFSPNAVWSILGPLRVLAAYLFRA
jgi:hypothetical protein